MNEMPQNKLPGACHHKTLRLSRIAHIALNPPLICDSCDSLVYVMFVTPSNNKIDYHITSRTSVTSFNLIISFVERLR